MSESIRVFSAPSIDYLQSLLLRYQVLRVPLVLEFSTADLRQDELDTHLGLFFNDRIMATLTLTGLPNNTLKMRQVAVRTAYQGRGYGKKIALYSHEYAVKIGSEMIECNARESAIPFYRSMGYELIGEPFIEVGIPHHKMKKLL